MHRLISAHVDYIARVCDLVVFFVEQTIQDMTRCQKEAITCDVEAGSYYLKPPARDLFENGNHSIARINLLSIQSHGSALFGWHVRSPHNPVIHGC